MFLGLRTTIYQVPDLAAAKVWYAKVLGVEPYFDEPFYVGFDVAGYELGLQPDAAASQAVENVVAYWGVPDCAKAYAHLLACGATAKVAPMSVGGDILVATVLDPFGNVFGVIENPGFAAR